MFLDQSSLPEYQTFYPKPNHFSLNSRNFALNSMNFPLKWRFRKNSVTFVLAKWLNNKGWVSRQTIVLQNEDSLFTKFRFFMNQTKMEMLCKVSPFQNWKWQWYSLLRQPDDEGVPETSIDLGKTLALNLLACMLRPVV